MTDLAPHLLSALQNADEYQVCCVAVGLVGDISRALGPKMMPYCDRIITHLLQNLQSRDLVCALCLDLHSLLFRSVVLSLLFSLPLETLLLLLVVDLKSILRLCFIC